MEQLGWWIDQAVFVKRLDELCVVRNNVTHFNPDPQLPSGQVALPDAGLVPARLPPEHAGTAGVWRCRPVNVPRVTI